MQVRSIQGKCGVNARTPVTNPTRTRQHPVSQSPVTASSVNRFITLSVNPQPLPPQSTASYHLLSQSPVISHVGVFEERLTTHVLSRARAAEGCGLCLVAVVCVWTALCGSSNALRRLGIL